MEAESLEMPPKRFKPRKSVHTRLTVEEYDRLIKVSEELSIYNLSTVLRLAIRRFIQRNQK